MLSITSMKKFLIIAKLTLREAHFLLAAIKENQDYYIKEHGLEQVKDKLEEALK